MSVCNSPHSQDSLDNIVIEEEQVQSRLLEIGYEEQDDELDQSLHKTFEEIHSFIRDEEDQSQIEEDEEDNEGYEKNGIDLNDKNTFSQNPRNFDSIILGKIQNKRKSIFESIPRSEYKLIQQQSKKKLKYKKLGEDIDIFNYNRREKSLEELSKKFLSLFLDKEESTLSLDKITSLLGVERRRIYDIINILESLRLVSRKGKNNYKWNGFQKIYETIHEYDLRELTIKEEEELAEDSQKREKSLEILSVGFLRLFMHWKRTMTLEEAARKLSYKQIDCHKIKTKIRRLYDIANVFKSLGLIKKTSLFETKKPAFQWIGVDGLDTLVNKIKSENGNTIVKGCFVSDIKNNLCSLPRKKKSEPNFEGNTTIEVANQNNIDKNMTPPITSSNISKAPLTEKPQLRKAFILEQQKREQKEKEEMNNSIQILLNSGKDQNKLFGSTTANTQPKEIDQNIYQTENPFGSSLLNSLLVKCITDMLTNNLMSSFSQTAPSAQPPMIFSGLEEQVQSPIKYKCPFNDFSTEKKWNSEIRPSIHNNNKNQNSYNQQNNAEENFHFGLNITPFNNNQRTPILKKTLTIIHPRQSNLGQFQQTSPSEKENKLIETGTNFQASSLRQPFRELCQIKNPILARNTSNQSSSFKKSNKNAVDYQSKDIQSSDSFGKLKKKLIGQLNTVSATCNSSLPFGKLNTKTNQ